MLAAEPTTRAATRDRRLLAVAYGLIAVHLVVHTLLGPRIVSHLPGAVGALALLALGALVASRGSAGAAAAFALGIATLALADAGAALAGHPPEPSAGLLVAAGVALAWTGVRMLWQTRRPDGHRVVRRTAVAVAAVVIAFELVVPVAVALLATQRAREGAAVARIGGGQRTVTLHTPDGLALAATYVPSRNGAAVITFPDRTWTAAQSRLLARHGYGVLALDMRGYGASEGQANAFGWGAGPDLRAAATWLRSRRDVRDGRVGGLGLSVGAEQLLEAAAGDRRIRAVVADGAGERSVRETLHRGIAAALVLPQQAIQTLAVAALSGTAPPPALDDLLGRLSPRPVLFIEAGRGTGGEERDRDYARLAGPGARLWYVPEASHTHALDARPAAYERRVIGFLDAALRRGAPAPRAR